MAELKTKKSTQDVTEFISTITDAQQRKDCEVLHKLMKKITKEKGTMWGKAMVGYGKYKYQRKGSKQEFEWFLTGFSPRKGNLSLYIMPGFEKFQPLMEKLGKHKTGKGCLYVKTLADVDMKILEKLITQGYKEMKRLYETKPMESKAWEME